MMSAHASSILLSVLLWSTSSIEAGVQPRLLLSYTTHFGLCNQLQMHKSAFMIAHAMGAELILAPARRRKNFKEYYVTDSFQHVPIDTLLNVESAAVFWSRRGLIVHRVSFSLDSPVHRRERRAAVHRFV